MTARGELESFLESRGQDKAADYAQRGRQFRDLGPVELERKFLEAARELAEQPFDPVVQALQFDVESEYLLRQVKAPYHLAAEDYDKYCEKVDARIAELKKHDPAEHARIRSAQKGDLLDYWMRRNAAN